MARGSCLCGQIEYEVELIPYKTFNCHCSYCRKAHGAAFVTLTLAKGETLRITKGKENLKEHKNNLGGFRAFCANCGTRLMNYAPDKSLYLSVALSTVDTPVDFKPSACKTSNLKRHGTNPMRASQFFKGYQMVS